MTTPQSPQYQGFAVGGPAVGKYLAAPTRTILVPVKIGPNRGEGDRGFEAALYEFVQGVWKFQGTGTVEI